ncbi:Asp-tRNA(Asn)/Glu-tRNA(Gln) amidotransferase subunit GatC [Clostridium paridis]|uniref:Aspartyl/glutamyl-tRNA(Asn/Gln) amidotransferase subunit C n=1 Tax=Clostridium paridis TaxID=2803863 RepID=A0A937FCH7_9CLOT|nr:Asp-tRNA(Asn)/Glu-tRNA(Gln) amidotransferase subunit GatC [Clostridium paridis]MBL4930743.1 Asp-tRNA(Asn)/Glu-tRNA(Gln) amidotransferase subunit GatC [Clostridium paridis]
MKITAQTVNYISRLAKLKFSEEEEIKMAKELESILTHFETIDKLDLCDIELNVFSKNLKPVLRKDEDIYFEEKEKLFANVKSFRNSAIIVPKIIE